MIFNPFTPIPKHPKSHVRGWSLLWAELLGCSVAGKDTCLSDAKALYLDHGVNFGGSMNLFGGVTGEMVDGLIDVITSKADIVSLDIPMPNYVDQLEKRLGQKTCHPALAKLLPCLRDRLDVPHLTMASLKLPHVTIGDSHSTAFSAPGSAVLRTNGATLYGALKNNSIEAQLDALGYSPERVTLVYGSIDIRHHIGRQKNPIDAVVELAQAYVKRARDIQLDYMVEIEVAAPVPVEYEERKIPQTGFYQGTPFTGSFAERRAWTALFIDLLQQAGLKVAHPPFEWYSMDGKEYAEKYMELSSSVHIAPTHYRRYSQWS